MLSNSIRIPFKDSGDPFVTRDVSSAYWEILYSSPSIVIPYISSLYLINTPTILAHNKNKKGEMKFGLPAYSLFEL